jgi:type IV pilus assembly protein PilB
MAVSSSKSSLSGLPRRLVRDDLMSQEDAIAAIATSHKTKERFVSVVIKNYGIAANDLAASAGQEFGLPVFDLDVFELEYLPTEQLKEELIEKHFALPVSKRGSRLYIAISDPTNLAALDEFKFNTGLSTEAVLVEDDKLESTIQRAFQDQTSDLGEGLDEDLDDLDISDGEDAAKKESNAEIDETPVVRFVNKVLLDGINRGASDIHIEPYEKIFRVRYRIDGMLEKVANPPLNMSSRIAARVKVMSRMDISERRVPQDGRIKLKISKSRAIDFRVNTCPTLFGEKIVLRILDPTSAQLGIEMLGYEESQQKLYLDALNSPYGMILVTGPTGSGKTVSLYTGLNILNQPDTNISTVEDPAEINMPGINQVNVNYKVGLTFSEALKSFLRQDPDIIMVGEIRDLETADIAIKAAQTGHLVLSTLHTNDAPQTLTRLVNMGVPPFNIATSVTLIIAQRLGRRLCNKCKAPDSIPGPALVQEGFQKSDLKSLRIYKAVGCNQCNNGYKGRVGIYQVMPISEHMGRIIMSGGNALDIAKQAEKEGVADLRKSALSKVKAGVMSLEEANRVTRD